MTSSAKPRTTWFVAAALWALMPGVALAARDVPSHTPPRLGFAEGEVSFWRPALGDWQSATLNLPLAPGDVLATGARSRAELQLRRGVYLRLASQSELELVEQTDSFYRFELGSGVLALHARAPIGSGDIEILSGSFRIRPTREGLYRLERRDGRVRLVTRDGARARVSNGIDERELGSDLELLVDDSVSGPLPIAQAAPPPDEWDTWNFQRTASLLRQRGRFASDVVGLDELDAYGEWQSVPTYGLVWFPRVPRMWTPYSVGRWIWDPFYGWTWVDVAPWGWAPFHYGRWVWVGGRWGWVLGPPAPRLVYAPALVAFYVGKGVFVGVGTVAPPVVAWVPLGWGEPCIPWWGPTWFVGKPWWGGWHGPRRPFPAERWRETHRPPSVTPVDDFEHGRGRRGLRWATADRFGLFPVVTARTEPVEIERLAFPGRDLPRRPAGAHQREEAVPRPTSPFERVVPGGREHGRDVRLPRGPQAAAAEEMGASPRPRRPPRSGETLPADPQHGADPARKRAAEERWSPFAPRFRSGDFQRDPESFGQEKLSRPQPRPLHPDRAPVPRGPWLREGIEVPRRVPRAPAEQPGVAPGSPGQRDGLELQPSRPAFRVAPSEFGSQRSPFETGPGVQINRERVPALDLPPRRPNFQGGGRFVPHPPVRAQAVPGGGLFTSGTDASSAPPERRRELPTGRDRRAVQRGH
ncbi:MAG: hypothetical protein N3C12_01380 [Candidatus Binatia bacterium]|nr:hypothetical protein [Candidatus Binatia bacterium]